MDVPPAALAAAPATVPAAKPPRPQRDVWDNLQIPATILTPIILAILPFTSGLVSSAATFKAQQLAASQAAAVAQLTLETNIEAKLVDAASQTLAKPDSTEEAKAWARRVLQAASQRAKLDTPAGNATPGVK